MPKSTQANQRPKTQDTLTAPRYVSQIAINSMNSYEKMLARHQQAAKAAGVKLLRKKMGMEAGALSGLFSAIH